MSKAVISATYVARRLPYDPDGGVGRSRGVREVWGVEDKSGANMARELWDYVDVREHAWIVKDERGI